MITINWKEFKTYKIEHARTGVDNFEYLIRYVRSYYNVRHVRDMFETFSADSLATQLMDKHGISNEEKLDTYLISKKLV